MPKRLLVGDIVEGERVGLAVDHVGVDQLRVQVRRLVAVEGRRVGTWLDRLRAERAAGQRRAEAPCDQADDQMNALASTSSAPNRR